MKIQNIPLKKWQKKKPIFPCLFVCRTKCKPGYDYDMFVIKKIVFEDKYYYGIVDNYGDEWGDLSDFWAEEYFIIEKHKK